MFRTREELLAFLEQHPEAVESAEVREAQAYMQQRVEGTYWDFVLGIFVGMILGYLTIFFLLSPRITKRMRSGLLLGLVVSIPVSAVFLN